VVFYEKSEQEVRERGAMELFLQVEPSTVTRMGDSADSLFAQLLQEDYFIQVQLDPEAETLVWPNGLDFCPDTLYLWGWRGRLLFRSKHTAAFFTNHHMGLSISHTSYVGR